MRPWLVLGRIFGITIGLHSSWFLIFVLVTWSLAVGYLPATYPGWSMGAYWITGLVSSVLFFGSVLTHELAHSLMARREGVNVTGITLFVFGGVAQIGGEPRSAGAEFRISAVGPLTSVVLGGLFSVIAMVAGNEYVAASTLYLGRINLLLALFNLIPGFPLDGGRILRAALWKLKGNFQQATQWAVMSGKFVGYGLVIVGVMQIFVGRPMNGLWIAFIGWFLSNAAEASQQQVVLRDMLAGVKARDLMNHDCEVVPADLHVDELVHDHILGGGRRCFLVMHGGGVDGMVTIHNIKGTPRERWPEVTTAEVMTPVEKVQAARVDDDALRLLERMDQADVNQMPVMENGAVRGMITREDLLRYIRTRAELAA